MATKQDSSSAPDIPSQPEREVKPSTVLFVLTAVFWLVYIDRGAFASNAINGKRRSEKDPDGSGFQGEFGLSNFEDGLLSSLFMFGILIGSPVFSQAVHYFNPFRIIGTATLLWAVAVGFCGLSQEFYTMAFCRIFVGFGEAAVLAIAPTYIDDHAPREKVSTWLAILFLAIPAGFSSGYLVGTAFGSLLGWRSVFFAEALLMMPFIVFSFRVPPIALNMGQLTDLDADSSFAAQLKVLWRDACIILSHAVYSVTLISGTLHTGVLGVLSYWGAKAAKAMFHMRGTDVWVGGVVLLTGIVGILSGGSILDRVGSNISNALYIGSAATFTCALILAPIFLFIESFAAFLFPFTICFTCMFIQLAPVSAVTLWSVPLHLRPLGTSLHTIVIHLVGDMPSPALCGLLLDLMEDHFDKSEETAYRIAFALCSVFLILASIVFFIAGRIGKNAKDYRVTADPQHRPEERQSAAASGSDPDGTTTPLL